jgi:Fe-S cluster assembly protein SufD
MNTKIKIKKNQEKIIPFVWINGEEKEVSIDGELSSDGGSVHLVGIFLGTKNSSVIFNTKILHNALHTKSRTTIRGVFLDNSSFNNDGLITIIKGAKHADGYFASKILLFDNAKGRSVPSLEIDENEVKAGHASTVGRPDAEQLFYLQSRGLSEKEAQQLIISGFFDPALQYLPEKKQKEIKEKIIKELLRN